MYNILGIANPMLDYIVHISDEALNFTKGGMEPISLDEFKANGKISAGGSATNVIKALANLGEKCALTGKMGSDKEADQFLHNIERHGITPLYLRSPTPTGKVICLVTPDGERTMRAYLGASQEMGPTDLDPQIFHGVSLVHIEGHALLSPGLTEEAMRLAKEAGAKVSFDLANFEMVQEKKNLILSLLQHVDIVFANEKESFALTGLDPKKSCAFLKQYCEIAVVSCGKKGCIVADKSELFCHPAFIVENPVDTTGAGDLFAGGFLYGYLHNKSLKECARIGNLLGAAVVQIDGAEIPPETWDQLKFKVIN